MGFFNEEFYKELDKDYDPSEESNDEFVFEDEEKKNDKKSNKENTFEQSDSNASELVVNKNNQNAFDDIMNKASIRNDSYWDSNNPIIKIILLVLGVIIILGVVYYIFGWISLF